MFNFGYRKCVEFQHTLKYFTSAVSDYLKELLPESQLVNGMTFRFSISLFASNPQLKLYRKLKSIGFGLFLFV